MPGDAARSFVRSSASPRAVKSVLVPVFVLAACDPAGPGSRGAVNVPSGTGGAWLHVRQYPAGAGDFGRECRLEGTICEGVMTTSVRLLPDVHVVPYEIQTGIGWSPTPDWEVVAWVSSDATAVGPAAGEPYGVQGFALHPCGWWWGGYCGSSRVDVNIGDVPR